jgi:hypothetical protein
LLGGRDVKKIDRIAGSARSSTESKTKGYNRGQCDPAEFTELHALPSSWPNESMEQGCSSQQSYG